jgi:hypothetical protein
MAITISGLTELSTSASDVQGSKHTRPPADRTEKDRTIPPDVLSAMHACVQQLRVTFLPRAQPV